MTIEEASVNINNPDLITAIKSAIVCTNTKDTYSSGFRNGLRYVIALLTDEEPKYEDVPKQDDAISMLKEQPEIIRCKDCRWYDEKISFCDNCNLPREQTFFCADGNGE